MPSCIHAIVSRSPWGHDWVAPDKRHCKQWTSSLFLWIFAYSLYPRPVPLTYQPRICKDGFVSVVTRSLISLGNAFCSTGRWSIIGPLCQTLATSVVVRDHSLIPQYLLKFWNCQVRKKIQLPRAIESNDLKIIILLTLKVKVKNVFLMSGSRRDLFKTFSRPSFLIKCILFILLEP